MGKKHLAARRAKRNFDDSAAIYLRSAEDSLGSIVLAPRLDSD